MGGLLLEEAGSRSLEKGPALVGQVGAWGGDPRKVGVPICLTRRLSHHDSGLLFHAERTASGSQRPACKQKWASSLLVLKEEGRELLYHRLAHSSRAARGEEAPKKLLWCLVRSGGGGRGRK